MRQSNMQKQQYFSLKENLHSSNNKKTLLYPKAGGAETREQ